MKLTNSLILASIVSAQQNQNSTDDSSIGRMGGGVTGGMGIRRYSDLLKLVKVFTPEFDERKYWAYGCNCLILGDRPMSDPGFGRPVDPLDQICKQYKDCQKCVKREYGDNCIGEFVKYDWRMRRGQPQCINAPGTCERNLCECDLDFARKMPSQYDVFDNKYHLFWSEEGWEPKDNCEKGKGLNEPECCGPPEGPLVIFNSLQKQCCPDFSIRPTGTC
jgi:hypothetical protein